MGLSPGGGGWRGYLTASPVESALPSVAAPAPDGQWGHAGPLEGTWYPQVSPLSQQQPLGPAHPGPAQPLPVPWCFLLSSTFSCSRHRSFRSRAARPQSCSQDCDCGGTGATRVGRNLTRQSLLHPPGSNHSFIVKQPEQTLPLGDLRLVPRVAAQGSGFRAQAPSPQAQV